MMGVGRKIRERRRVKRMRQSSRLDVDTDVDYGALDPLDGEEGELVGCVCTGWGDGACTCGYGYWDVYDYEVAYTREPEPVGGESPPTYIVLIPANSVKCFTDSTPSPLTRLPTELFLHVLSYLPVRSVLAVASTCKAWRTLALDNSVWWRLWQAREGTPHFSSHIPNRSPERGRRGFDSFPVRGRRYRGIKDEGIHGLPLHAPEHEHDEGQWDVASGWAIDFERANLMLKERTGMGIYVHSKEQYMQDGQQLDNITPEQEESSAIVTTPPAISRQSPLMLDWHRLYRDRAVLEQRWRDPEGEPHVLRIEGHRDR